MLLRRFGTFTGGIDLPDEKAATLDKAIEPWEALERLRVPLAPCPGASARQMVSVGQQVRAGEKIGAAVDDGVDIFAPLAGRVVGFPTVAVAGTYGWRSCPAIELAVSSQPLGLNHAPVLLDWQGLEGAALRDLIAQGSIVIHRRNGGPLRRWVARARTQRCRTLAANAMEQQPLVTADHRLLAEYGREIIIALAILGRAIGAQDIILAVENRHTEAYRGLLAPAREHNITRIALAHKYPTEADAILTKVLTRRAVPPGRGPMDTGVAVIDPGSCLEVYRWVVCQKRLAGRVVTVWGHQARRGGNYFVPFGADCVSLADENEMVVIHGGPMVGLRCGADAVVSPATNAVLSIDQSRGAAPSPCIRCGWCTDHCPARLNVAALNDDFELGMVKRAARSGILACVSCGVCSYVCPARLPLAQRVNELKWMITEGRAESLSADGRQ
jgi:electron transport complex protein RnfC